MSSGRAGEETFFIYDHTVLQKEEDDLKDAIIYFYPQTVSVENQCGICGQLMGMVTFCTSIAGSPPLFYRLRHMKFAIKHLGRYSLAIGGSTSLPDSILKGQLDHLYSVFVFYHRDLEEVQQMCRKEERDHLDYLALVWDTYVPFIRRYGQSFQAAMQAVPTVHLPKSMSCMFLRASQLLQSCQRAPGVIAGCLLLKNEVLCTQLTSTFTSRLLIVRPHQTHLPCQLVQTEFTLPMGVRLLCVHVTRKEAAELDPKKTRRKLRCHLGKSQFHFPDSVGRKQSSVPQRHPGGKKSEHPNLGGVGSSDHQASSLNPNACSGFKVKWNNSTVESSASTTKVPSSWESPSGQDVEDLVSGTDNDSNTLNSTNTDKVLQNTLTSIPTGSDRNEALSTQLIFDGHSEGTCNVISHSPDTPENLQDLVSDKDIHDSGMCHLETTGDTQDMEISLLTPGGASSLTAQLEEHLLVSSVIHQSVSTISEISCANSTDPIEVLSLSPSVSTHSPTYDSSHVTLQPFETSTPITAPGHGRSLQSDVIGGTVEREKISRGGQSEGERDGEREVTHEESQTSGVGDREEVVRDCQIVEAKTVSVGPVTEKSGSDVILKGVQMSKMGAGDADCTDVTEETSDSSHVQTSEVQENNNISYASLSMEKAESITETASGCDFTQTGEESSKEPVKSSVEGDVERCDQQSCDGDGDHADVIPAEGAYTKCEGSSVSDYDIIPTPRKVVVDTQGQQSTETGILGVTQEFPNNFQPCNKNKETREQQTVEDAASQTDCNKDLNLSNDDDMGDYSNRTPHGPAANIESDYDVIPTPQKLSHCRQDKENKETQKQSPAIHPEKLVLNLEEAAFRIKEGVKVGGCSTSVDGKVAKDMQKSPKVQSSPTIKLPNTVELFKAVKEVATKSSVQHHVSLSRQTSLVDKDNGELDFKASIERLGHPAGSGDPRKVRVQRRSSSGSSSTSFSKPDKRSELHEDHSAFGLFTSTESGQSLPARSETSMHRKSSSSSCQGRRRRTKRSFSSSSSKFPDESVEYNESEGEIVPGRWNDPYGYDNTGCHDDDLETLDLYIQGNADLLLLLLLDRGTSQEMETVHTLWKWALPQLGDLDLLVKQSAVPLTSPKKKSFDYNHLQFNNIQKSMSGNTTEPVTSHENEFCEAVVHMHDSFLGSSQLTDVTLRGHHAYVYGHRSLNQETYFQQLNSARNSPGAPTDRDQAMCADARAYQKLFSDQHSLVI